MQSDESVRLQQQGCLSGKKKLYLYFHNTQTIFENLNNIFSKANL